MVSINMAAATYGGVNALGTGASAMAFGLGAEASVVATITNFIVSGAIAKLDITNFGGAKESSITSKNPMVLSAETAGMVLSLAAAAAFAKYRGKAVNTAPLLKSFVGSFAVGAGQKALSGYYVTAVTSANAADKVALITRDSKLADIDQMNQATAMNHLTLSAAVVNAADIPALFAKVLEENAKLPAADKKTDQQLVDTVLSAAASQIEKYRIGEKMADQAIETHVIHATRAAHTLAETNSIQMTSADAYAALRHGVELGLKRHGGIGDADMAVVHGIADLTKVSNNDVVAFNTHVINTARADYADLLAAAAGVANNAVAVEAAITGDAAYDANNARHLALVTAANDGANAGDVQAAVAAIAFV